MTETNDKQLSEAVSGIIIAEQKRAKGLAEDPIFRDWVQSFRERYIVHGFLMPLYSRDGRYSRSKRRVSKFGNYILNEEMLGNEFQEDLQGWVKNEEMWFWPYLTDGQEIIRANISIPDMLTVDGAPADLVWQQIVSLAKELHVFGENGGGILVHPNDMDESYLARHARRIDWHEGDDGYMESYKLPNTSHWISLFKRYESYQLSKKDIEIRPAWFHLANYAFFNVLIQKLPVFCSVFTKEGKIDMIRFLDNTLSDTARDYIGKELLSMPIEMREQISGDTLKRENQEMTWWLWRNVGHKEEKRTLTYREIVDISDTHKSSVQTSVERFTRKLNEELGGKLLERLLHTAGSLGLGYNLTYNTLVKHGLVPAREREIDGFDELDRLIEITNCCT